MRSAVIPFAVWIGVLQVGPGSLGVQHVATLVSLAGALAGLTVMIYRLGVWRQQMQSTKDVVGVELTRYREESGRHFERMDRRFDTIDRFIDQTTEQRVVAERWQSAAEARLGRLEAPCVHR
jgi:alpha-L-fucosidase